jgi:hypothetical protein
VLTQSTARQTPPTARSIQFIACLLEGVPDHWRLRCR